KKDLHKTFAILQDMCYTYKVAGVSRVRSALAKLLARMGFVAGILVFSVLVALARGYVWRVEITGNEAVPTKVIENVLAEHNIAVGKKLSAFDAGELSAAVRAIEGVTLASVRRVGTSVQVEVFESDPAAPPLAYSETDIVSRYDATVTRVIAREGTALVRPGDNVFASTPLIGAYRKSAEEGGEPLPSRAAGIVYGRVTFTYGTTVATERYEYVPESTKRRTRLQLFGISIGRKPKGGEGIEIVESRSKFNAFLPVTVITSRVQKMRRQKITATVDELAEQVEADALSRFIHSEVSSGFASHRTVRDLGGGLYRVNVFIEAEMIIGGA
ncbi:MAG: sporulation protein YqfD, partial [Clostridiales bacterium]|nr:sporulation protein YqfD [Clostridiales bacterium]